MCFGSSILTVIKYIKSRLIVHEETVAYSKFWFSIMSFHFPEIRCVCVCVRARARKHSRFGEKGVHERERERERVGHVCVL